MSFRVIACCIGITATFVLSAFGGPFDSNVGKYKGRGVERGSDGSTFYFTQTVKLEGSSTLSTATSPGVGTVREFIRFRANGTLSGSGTVLGYNFSWTVAGTWRKQGNLVKGRTTTYYADGSVSSSRYILRLEDGKVVMTQSGYSDDGTFVNSTYTGKLVEAAP